MDATWFNGDEPDPYPEGRYEQPDLLTCDFCGADAFTPVTTPCGVFCSRAHAEAEAARLTAQMEKVANG